MIYDQHVHTMYSVDSHEKIENYLKIIRNQEMKYFICCDHVDFNLINYKCDWLCDFEKRAMELNELKLKYPDITFLEGVELGFRYDHMEDMKKILMRDFDLVQLSVHDDGVNDYYKDIKNDDMMRVYFKTVLNAVSVWDDFNVLSHIDYGFKTYKMHNQNADIKKYKEILIKIFKVLIEKGKALEINTKVGKVVNDSNFTHLRDMLEIYKECGGSKLTLSSDSHTIQTFMVDFDKYTNVIKECGFDKLSYFIKRHEYFYYI